MPRLVSNDGEFATFRRPDGSEFRVPVKAGGPPAPIPSGSEAPQTPEEEEALRLSNFFLEESLR